MSLKVTGKNPSGKHLEKIKQSSNYKKDGFENLSETPMMLQDSSYYEIIKKYLNDMPDYKAMQTEAQEKIIYQNKI
jgi:hypothetical protein